MTEQNQVRKQMEDQLNKVNFRLEILDMIEEKLFKMKGLAQRVIDEDLTEKEIKEINMQIQGIVEQVKLLDSEATDIQ